MSDITEAPTQDAIADSLMVTDSSEPTAEQTGTEQTAEFQGYEQPIEQLETEAQSDETAEDWLPDEQDKVFTDDTLNRYAQRYGFDEQSLTNPQIRQLLVDKLNSDIYIRQQQQWGEQNQYQEVEEAQPEPTQQTQPPTREQYFQHLDRVIQERTDPEVAKQFHAEFLKSFGVPDAEIARMPASQAMQFTQTASKYMLNLMNTFMGDMLQANLSQQLSQAFPGFGDMYERSSYAMAWDQVRNSNPQFNALPAYGTKEFSSTLREASRRIPGFDEMQFTDAQGRALPAMENAQRKYSMLAQIASGQNVDPALIQKAVATGQRQATRAAQRRAAGNLGSGQSTAASPGRQNSKFQTNTDLFDSDTMDLYQREHGRL